VIRARDVFLKSLEEIASLPSGEGAVDNAMEATELFFGQQDASTATTEEEKHRAAAAAAAAATTLAATTLAADSAKASATAAQNGVDGSHAPPPSSSSSSSSSSSVSPSHSKPVPRPTRRSILDAVFKRVGHLERQEVSRWSQIDGIADQALQITVDRLRTTRAARSFMMRFSRDPIAFIARYVSSNGRGVGVAGEAYEVASCLDSKAEPEQVTSLFASEKAAWMKKGVSRFLMVQPYLDRHSGRAVGRNG
jgi:hypothetical protein